MLWVRVWTLEETLYKVGLVSTHIFHAHLKWIIQNSRGGASRAVGDGRGARGDGDQLGAVDGRLRSRLANGSHGGGNKASGKDHGTHLEVGLGWFLVVVSE